MDTRSDKGRWRRAATGIASEWPHSQRDESRKSILSLARSLERPFGKESTISCKGGMGRRGRGPKHRGVLDQDDLALLPGPAGRRAVRRRSDR